MATHGDLTDTVAAAVLAQSDNVMNAVQVMRDQAIDSGTLVSGPERTVEVSDEETVLSDKFEPVSVCRGDREFIPNKTDATQQERQCASACKYLCWSVIFPG